MSIFDATNDRIGIRILNGGQVLLEQAERYFYFADTDPATHLGAKEAIKWDAVDTDSNPILPSSITIGPDNIVGAVPTAVLEEFLKTGTPVVQIFPGR